jgi:hypothetical protein
LEPDDGHAGNQRSIEKILNGGGTLYKHLLEKFPNCPQKLAYVRRSHENAVSDQCYSSGAELLEFLPEDERVQCLEEIFQKSMALNRAQWAENAIKIFPQSEKWNNRRKELLEIIVRTHLDAGCANWAEETAKKIPRKLTSPELEEVIAKNLTENFSSAETAIGIAGRKFSLKELRTAVANARGKKYWELLLKIAQMFPDENCEEREALISEAHGAFIEKGDAGGISEVCKAQRNRKMTTVELKSIFEKACKDLGVFHNSVSHYAEQLVKDPANMEYLEKMAKDLIAERSSNALDIAIVLPEKSIEKIAILEAIGSKVFKHQQDGLVSKCAIALPDGNAVRTKLAQYLVKKSLEKYARISSGKDIVEILKSVNLLPNSDEKLKQLERLFDIAEGFEKKRDKDDLNTSGYYDVVSALNTCG